MRKFTAFEKVLLFDLFNTEYAYDDTRINSDFGCEFKNEDFNYCFISFYRFILNFPDEWLQCIKDRIEQAESVFSVNDMKSIKDKLEIYKSDDNHDKRIFSHVDLYSSIMINIFSCFRSMIFYEEKRWFEKKNYPSALHDWFKRILDGIIEKKIDLFKNESYRIYLLYSSEGMGDKSEIDSLEIKRMIIDLIDKIIFSIDLAIDFIEKVKIQIDMTECDPLVYEIADKFFVKPSEDYDSNPITVLTECPGCDKCKGDEL